VEDSYRFRNDDLRGWCVGKHRDTVLSCGKDERCHTFAIAVSLFFRPFAIILPKARFSHFEDVSGVTIPQDKVRKLVPSGMVVHELLHTGQNLVTEGVKIDLCLDQDGGHLVILPRQELKLPICIFWQSGRLKLLPIGQAVQSNLHGVDLIGLHPADTL